MADTLTRPELAAVANVHLLTTGRYHLLRGGRQDFTAEDLAAAVAAVDDPAVRAPVLKLGHTGDDSDGSGLGERPAIGRVVNLRRSADGHDLYGDFVGVPAWLAAILPHAYPSRSFEGARNLTTDSGTTHRLVLTAVALLGENLPALGTLEDVRSLFYGEAGETQYGAESRFVILDAEQPKMGETLAGAINLEDVRRAFYDERPAGSYAWIREMWSDFLIVEDDSGNLHRVPWSEGSDGVDFGDWEEVKVQYVAAAEGPPREPLGTWARDDVPAEASEASDDVAVYRGVISILNGQGGSTNIPDDERQRIYDHAARRIREAGEEPATLVTPDGTQPTDTDDADVADTSEEVASMSLAEQVRERLGLGDDVPEDDVLARLDELVATTAEGGEQAPGPEGGSGTQPPPEQGRPPVEAPPTAPEGEEDEGAEGAQPPATQRMAAGRIPEGMALVDRDALDELQAMARDGREARRQQREERREQILEAAWRDGKFPPSHLERWRQRWQEDPEGTEDLVANVLEAGLIPVDEVGHDQGDEPTETTPEQLGGSLMFPELEAARQR